MATIQLHKLAQSTSFSENSLYIDVDSPNLAQAIARQFEPELACWALLLRKKFAVVRSPKSEIKISAFIADTPEELPPMFTAMEEPRRLLWFAQVSINPVILRLANDLMERPRKGCIIRLSDERQILMGGDCGVLITGYSFESATNWTRSDYFLPEDLEDVRRLSRQQNTFVKNWRSLDPDHPENGLDGWQYTTRASLIDGGDGTFYHLTENLDYSYSPPVR